MANHITSSTINFESSDFYQLNMQLSSENYSTVWIICDSNTVQHCLPLLLSALSKDIKPQVIVVPAGESHKNIATCELIWKQLLEGNADRKSLVLNLGGGVVGDMGGFCAATFKRGMDFIQLPTTLLSQVDASVGGKLGIDFGNLKNAIGLFQQPLRVLIYSGFLQTLPKRELYSGFAEMLKHGLIANKYHWDEISKIDKLEGLPMERLIAQSVATKERVVEEDPLEKGLRKILNFGHTIGHAIESLSWETENPLLHGEAVAIGMLCEAYLSTKISGLSAAEFAEIEATLRRFYPPYSLKAFDTKAILDLMYQDKKNEKNKISLSLLSGIGRAVYDQVASDELILESLAYLE